MRLKAKLANHWDVIAWFVFGARLSRDCYAVKSVCAYWIEQAMIDPNAIVFLPGAALIIPKSELAGAPILQGESVNKTHIEQPPKRRPRCRLEPPRIASGSSRARRSAWRSAKRSIKPSL